jgi:hypothetical protein
VGVTGAAAAKVECELFRFFAGLRIDHDLPERHPAVVAGVGALVLVVVILGGWLRVRCARLIHVNTSVVLAVPREVAASPGLITLSTVVLSHARIYCATVSA